jgi:hypothetical protein
MNRMIAATVLVSFLVLSGCGDAPKNEETPTTRMLNRLTESKRRFRELPDIKTEQIIKKQEIQKNYFTPLDLERTGVNTQGNLTPDSLDKMGKLLDDAEKEMSKFPK